MGKRSEFARRPQDAYFTPKEAVVPLLPFISGVRTFAEPCCGDRRLVRHLNEAGLYCLFSGDIEEGFDALEWEGGDYFDVIITNPPWTRSILHQMIERFQSIAPTWLLFDADWAHTKQSAPFMDKCSDIVSVGRLRWIDGTKHTGKDNCAWYRFHADHQGGPRFHGRVLEAA